MRCNQTLMNEIVKKMELDPMEAFVLPTVAERSSKKVNVALVDFLSSLLKNDPLCDYVRSVVVKEAKHPSIAKQYSRKVFG